MRALRFNNRRIKFPLLFIALLEPKLMVKYAALNVLFIVASVLAVGYMFINCALSRKRPTKMFWALLVWRLSFGLQTILNQGDITMWGYFSLVVLGLCMVFDFYMPIDGKGLIKGLTQVLTLYLAINLLTVILWPDGVVDGLYFIGIRTRFTELAMSAMVFSLIRDQQEKKKLSFRTVCVISMSIVSILTEWVATAIVGIFLCFVSYFILRKSKGFTKLLTLTRAMLVSLAINVAVIAFNVQKNFAWLFVDVLGKDVDLTYRTELWALALKQIAKRPLFGYGQSIDGCFIRWWRSSSLWQAHNQWLQLLHDGGIVSALCFIAMIVLCSIALNRRRESASAKLILCGMIAFLVMMLAEIYSYTPYFILLLCVGFNIGLCKNGRRSILQQQQEGADT